MCGIFGIVHKENNRSDTHDLERATRLISYRGPDDEGFLLYNAEYKAFQSFSGDDSSTQSREEFNLKPLPKETTWQVGLGHRRLSIIDLSTGGYQPMVRNGLAICYNGEIYNYKEIRAKLISLGFSFKSQSDTEVILAAWEAWGVNSLSQFNGMFAFLLIDKLLNKVYAVRDRFGIKPLYYYCLPEKVVFASEVKQFRSLPDYSFKLNEQTAIRYLQNGEVDYDQHTFEESINQLKGGELMEMDLNDPLSYAISKWYSLKPQRFKGSEDDAFEKFHFLLKDSIELRLRSDVTLGSCLSGGLDSSTIVCLMREILRDKQIKTVTSCFKDERFDEWEYAQTIIDHANCNSYRVFPSIQKLQAELDNFIYHLDYPFDSTSQYSQWNVFRAASDAKLKVMVDGQGADEQLAGYGGNDLSLYYGLLRKLKLLDLIRETFTYRKKNGRLPYSFILGAIQKLLPAGVNEFFPQRYRPLQQSADWLHSKYDLEFERPAPENLNNWLKYQVLHKPLPSLLRYEDRSSMAFSIESRVPFLDYRLVEFTLGLRENLIYKNGLRKYLLRKSMIDHVPAKILNRTDKMGFVSPEEVWFKHTAASWFEQEALDIPGELGYLINTDNLRHHIRSQQSGAIPFTYLSWRMICINRWLKNLTR